MRKCLGILLLWWINLNCVGQQLHFYVPDNLKQLPSSETYKVMQDSRGYIWICTEAGLCRFDGNSLKIFDKHNGLLEEAVYNICEDRSGVIWMVTATNRILYLSGDDLKEAPFSKDFYSHFKEGLYVSYSLKASDDSLFMNVQYSTYSAAKKSNKVQMLSQSAGERFLLRKTKDAFLNIEDPKFRKKVFNDNKNIVFTVARPNSVKTYTIFGTKQINPGWRVLTVEDGNKNYFASFDKLLVKITPDDNIQVQELPNRVIDLYIDRNNGLWVGTLKGGVLYYADTRLMTRPVVNLEGYSVSNVCEDDERGIWCSTLEKGVLYCRNKSVKFYPEIKNFEKKAEILKVCDSSLFISTTQNELIELKRGEFVTHKIPTGGIYYLSDIIRDQDGSWLICGGDFAIRMDKNFKVGLPVLKSKRLMVNIRQLVYVPEKRVMACQSAVLFEIRDKHLFSRKVIEKAPLRYLYYEEKGYFLGGFGDLLCRADTHDFSLTPFPGFRGKVSKIIARANGEVWIITKENGIFTLQNNILRNVSKELNIGTDRFLDITEDGSGTLWLGSNIGLVKISFISGKPKVSVYNVFNGLPGNEIFNVAATRDELYFSTNQGIYSFNLSSDLSNKSRPAIRVEALLVNDKNILNATSSLKLKHFENNLKIRFNLLTYKGVQSMFYNLENTDGDKSNGVLSNNELTLNSLSPGNYSLKVYAINDSGLMSEHPVILNINISKPFWKTTWFVILCIVVFGALVFLIARRVISRIKQRERMKTEVSKIIAGYQLSALKAQMNPHFIFNSINSIQSYILTKRPEEAYTYLTKFSKLMRLVLDYSEENMVTLAQEVEIVKLYLELEQLRFEKKFTFSISIQEDINSSEMRLPALMLQPYVENSVWHGLMNKAEEEAKRVSLQFVKKGAVLEIRIEDNGIGRLKASSLPRHTHKPKATSINSKRTEILSLLGKGKGEVKVEDVIEDGVIAGTLVIITIPQDL